MATIENDKYRIEVEQEQSPMNPRVENDNLGKMVCFHKRYSLGDEHGYDADDYNGWHEMEKAIDMRENVAVILPLYLYDHSGITISTSPFSCPWDSGQVGFIYMTKKDAIENYGKKIMTKAVREKAEKYLKAEVETYDQYLTGEIYTLDVYEIKEDEADELIESIGGFYGDNFWTNGMADYTSGEVIESLKQELETEFGEQPK